MKNCQIYKVEKAEFDIYTAENLGSNPNHVDLPKVYFCYFLEPVSYHEKINERQNKTETLLDLPDLIKSVLG